MEVVSCIICSIFRNSYNFNLSREKRKEMIKRLLLLFALGAISYHFQHKVEKIDLTNDIDFSEMYLDCKN